MTKLMNILTTVASGLTLATGLAYGQEHVRVDIPFAFEAQHKTMAAGRYDMRVTHSVGSSLYLELRNAETKSGVLIAPQFNAIHGSANEVRFSFGCIGVCKLQSVTVGDRAYVWPQGKRKSHTEVAVVKGTVVHAD